MHSRPFFLSSFNVSNYRFRTRMESVVRHIPIADARWIGQRLGRLSREQIGDCFRAGGFSPAEVEGYTEVVMSRIVALEHLGEVKVPAARATASDTGAKECLESTCRQVPVRETLTAIGLGTAYVQAIVGGFEQGAGITGGVQLTSAGEIPAMQLRVAALTSTLGYRRFDVGAFIPSVGSSRNHADIWASHLQREVDVFGTSPQTSADLETQFAMTRRSYQGSLSRDLTSDLEGGVYAQVMDSRALLEHEHDDLAGPVVRRISRLRHARHARGLDPRPQPLRPDRVGGWPWPAGPVGELRVDREGIRRAGVRAARKSADVPPDAFVGTVQDRERGKSDSLLRPLLARGAPVPPWLPLL